MKLAATLIRDRPFNEQNHQRIRRNTRTCRYRRRSDTFRRVQDAERPEPIGIAIAISWLYFNQVSRLVNLLEMRPLKYIGVISYGIYMYQRLFLSTGPYRSVTQTWPPSQEIGLLLLLLSAPLSYHYFEKPFLRLKERYSASKAMESKK